MKSKFEVSRSEPYKLLMFWLIAVAPQLFRAITQINSLYW